MRAALATAVRRDRSVLATTLYDRQFSPERRAQFPNDFADQASRTDVEQHYFAPLLELLASYAETGDPIVRDLYLGEWRRYAPHRAGLGVLVEYFRAILPEHESAIASRVEPDAAAIGEWLSALHSPLTAEPTRPFRLLMVGDCLMGEVQTFLRPSAAARGLTCDFRYFYFSSLIGADIEADGVRDAIAGGVDAIAVSYLSYQGIPLYRSLLEGADTSTEAQAATLISGIVDFISSHLAQMRELTNVPILLHNASGVPLTRWRRLIPALAPLSPARRRVLQQLNTAIAEVARNIENCTIIDEVEVCQANGLRRAGQPMVSRALRRQAHFHHSWLSRFLADKYAEVLADFALLRKTKAVLLDFDNTLWDGVMADGAVEQFHERQQLLRTLSAQGIVLCAVSKNDPANIRWDELTLKQDDFAALKINWNLKVQSIQEIASELNLGMDAFLFLDDHPSERALVSQELPAVGVLDSTLAETWHTVARLLSMPNTTQTEEARQRTAMYRQQASRARTIGGSQDYPALMRSLQLKARIGAATRADRHRLTELIQRTNQFNTTTIRYQAGEVDQMLQDPDCSVIVGELGDRFGSLGLVGLAIVRRRAGEADIDSFIMSCRAMGFGFEHSLMAAAIGAAGDRTVRGRFIRTDRNEPSSGLFAATGFERLSDVDWQLPAGKIVQSPDWIEVEAR